MARLKKLEVRMHEAPDQQISLTDPDARSMATSGRGTGMVGYNVQTASTSVLAAGNMMRWWMQCRPGWIVSQSGCVLEAIRA